MAKKNNRPIFPIPGVTWGEGGLEDVMFLGQLPLSARGEATGNTYKWSAVRPVRRVDKRDLPSVQKVGGGVAAFAVGAKAIKSATAQAKVAVKEAAKKEE